MAYKTDSDTIQGHRAAILAVAVRHAKRQGYQKITRAEIAAECGVATGVVNAAFGTMSALRQEVMRYAVERGVIAIIADGLAARDPLAHAATAEQKAAALDQLTGAST